MQSNSTKASKEHQAIGNYAGNTVLPEMFYSYHDITSCLDQYNIKDLCNMACWTFDNVTVCLRFFIASTSSKHINNNKTMCTYKLGI